MLVGSSPYNSMTVKTLRAYLKLRFHQEHRKAIGSQKFRNTGDNVGKRDEGEICHQGLCHTPTALG